MKKLSLLCAILLTFSFLSFLSKPNYMLKSNAALWVAVTRAKTNVITVHFNLKRLLSGFSNQNFSCNFVMFHAKLISFSTRLRCFLYPLLNKSLIKMQCSLKIWAIFNRSLSRVQRKLFMSPTLRTNRGYVF